MTSDFQKLSVSEKDKILKKIKTEAKKQNTTLLYWGFPVGLNENFSVIYESEASLENTYDIEGLNEYWIQPRTGIIITQIE